MARFRAWVQGTRGAASRLGHQRIEAHASGWNGGITVTGYPVGHDAECIRGDFEPAVSPAAPGCQHIEEVFEVHMTGGSSFTQSLYVGRVEVIRGCAYWVAANLENHTNDSGKAALPSWENYRCG